MPRAIFRVFLSSTFGDFQAEREKLRAEVWPRLEVLCAAHGASFHVVDLRWGISPSVATTHDTIKICLDEVIRCQQLSPRPKPNFLMLIGDRYGWRPPAVQIPDVDFKQIRKAVSSDDAAFLAEWYRRDDNAVPPIWCLKPRTGEYSSYDAWGPVEARLTTIFHDASKRLGLAPEQYLYSATHMEIVSGLLQLEEAKDHVFSFNREISGLPDPAPKGIARRFTDHIGDGIRDPEARHLLQVLKDQIAGALPASQIHTFSADWIGEENNPITLNHLDDYCNAIEQSLRGIIDAEVKELAQSTPLQEELELQQQFLEDTGTLLIGRDKELKKIQAYLQRKKTPLPLIVRATGGAGKSALLAKAVMSQRGEECGTLIYRFIGAAPRSWQPQTFLQDLITQIAEAYGEQPPDLPEEGGIKKIAEQFHEQLELATAEQPLTLFIDAIDQFNSTSPVRYSDIFSKQLPANVRMVLSILEGRDSDQLERLYPKAPLIHLEQLSPAVCGKILDALLPGRKLTKGQRTTILDKAEKSGLPLWLTLVAPIARKLCSWDATPVLPEDIKELARYVIKRIADKHGLAITTASLRYIKLARFGLSETELQEILWADPEVKAEFDDSRNKDQPEVSALPPVFWSRLYAELDPYINEYWMDGQLLHRYFHRVFGEVADEMDEETRTTLHSRLADYFDTQPLYNELHANGRKLMEQTWHLTQAGRIEDARAFITDFENAMAKCKLNRSDDWADDFKRTANNEKTRDYRIWEGFVKSNAHILRKGNNEWPAHKILLQLAIEHADDSPATIGAEKFLADGKCNWAWLRRLQRVQHAGVNPCIAVLDGHTGPINGALEASDSKIISWSNDNTLRFWDLDGAQLSGFEVEDSISGVKLLNNGNLVSWTDSGEFHYWSLYGEQLPVHLKSEIDRNDNSMKMPIFFNDLMLTWANAKRTSLCLWNIEGKKIKVLNGHTKQIIGVLLTKTGHFITWSEDNTIRVWSNSGKMISVFKKHTGTIKGVIQLHDGRLLSWSEDNRLCLWDLCTNDISHKLETLPGHSGAITKVLFVKDSILTTSGETTIQIWDENARERKVLDHKSKVIDYMEIQSGILSWSEDKMLRIWNIDGALLHTLKGHRGEVSGVAQLPKSRVLSWSKYDKNMFLWSTSGDLIAELKGHKDDISGVIQLPEEKILSWSPSRHDHTLRIWDLDGKPIAVLSGHSDAIYDPKILADGRIITVSDDKTLRIWDQKGKPLIVIKCTVVPEVFHHNEDAVLYKSGNKQFGLLDLKSKNITQYVSVNDVYDARILVDGRVLSRPEGDSLYLWDQTGCLVNTLDGHTEGVKDFCVLDNGNIISISADGNIILWDKDGNLIKRIKINFVIANIISVTSKYINIHLVARNGVIYEEKYNILNYNLEILMQLDFDYISSDIKNMLEDRSDVAKLEHNYKLQNNRNYARFNTNNRAAKTLYWFGQADVESHRLYNDGRAVTTQADGQVCLLNTYFGMRQVTIDELE